MIDTRNKHLLEKAWSSLVHRGAVGLGRDVRDYLRWRLRRSPAVIEPPQEPRSNWDLNQEELQSLPDVLRSKPVLVYAESTSRCNLHCFMCRLSFPETTRESREHMKLETFARLEPLLEPGSRLSLFGLGEPLFNPNFVEMLRIAKERGSFVGLNSNAMLLTERIARAMVELEQDLLVISFSGGTKETYERVITGSNYEKVIGHVRRLNELKAERLKGDQLSAISYQPSAAGSQHPAPSTQDSGPGGRDARAPGRTQNPEPRTQNLPPGIEHVKPVLQLQFTAMRDNVAELPEMVRLALDLRCAGAVVMPLTVVDPSLEEQSLLNPDLWPRVQRAFAEARAVADGAGYPFDLQLPTDELMRAMEAKAEREMGESPLPLGEGRGEGSSATSQPSLTRPSANPSQGETRAARHPALSTQDSAPSTQHPALICYEPWQTFYARDDGTVNTCCYSNRVLGDLKTQTALEIWNGEPYRKFRARMRSANKPSECRVCHKLRGDDQYDQRVDDSEFYDEL